jgi:hypothetical protein
VAHITSFWIPAIVEVENESLKIKTVWQVCDFEVNTNRVESYKKEKTNNLDGKVLLMGYTSLNFSTIWRGKAEFCTFLCWDGMTLFSPYQRFPNLYMLQPPIKHFINFTLPFQNKCEQIWRKIQLWVYFFFTIYYILWHLEPLLGNSLDTSNETFLSRQQILNKQVYAAITG